MKNPKEQSDQSIIVVSQCVRCGAPLSTGTADKVQITSSPALIDLIKSLGNLYTGKPREELPSTCTYGVITNTHPTKEALQPCPRSADGEHLRTICM